MSVSHGQLAVTSSGPLAGAAAPGTTTHMRCTVGGPAVALAPLPAAASMRLWLPRQHAGLLARVQQAACSSLARLLGPCRQAAARTTAYSLHPAVGDACLHLGALPAAQRAALCVRVPVAAEAYAAPADAHPSRGGWAATMRPPEASGTAVTSACWVPGCGATSAMHLQGLATLPMPLPQVWPHAAGCVRRLRRLEHRVCTPWTVMLMPYVRCPGCLDAGRSCGRRRCSRARADAVRGPDPGSEHRRRLHRSA